MDVGLNSDFLLDEEAPTQNEEKPTVTPVTDSEFDEVVFDDPVPGEVPELKDGVAVIIQLKNKMDDLEYFRQDVSKAGGMNTSFAMEAAAHISNFINEDRTIEYFTKNTSLTQFKATLEAIDEEKASLLKRIIARIKEMIARFVEWIKAIYKRIVSRGGVNEESLKVYEYSSKKEVAGPLSKLSEVASDSESEMNSLKARTKANFKEIEAEEFFNELEKRFDAIERQVSSLYASINSNKLAKAVVLSPKILETCFIAAHEEKRMLSAFKAVYQYAIMIGDGKYPDPGVRPEDKKSDEYINKTVSKLLDKIRVGSTGMTTSDAADLIRNGLFEIEQEEITPKTHPLNSLVTSFSGLFSIETAKQALAGLGSSDAEYSEFQKLLANSEQTIRRFTGKPEDIKTASVLITSLAKSFNDHFVLRLHYGNLLNIYVSTARSIDSLLKRYNKEIFIATATMDEKFQDFIKSHFSNGSPEFFTKD